MPLIYIIDDNKETLGLLTSLLQKKKFEVSTFSNGNVAFNAIKLRKPQLILLDVFLSNNYDGLDLCQKLKGSPYSKDIPVIVTSGFDEIAQSAITEFGADDFIAKPIQFKKMLQKINAVLLKND